MTVSKQADNVEAAAAPMADDFDNPIFRDEE